MQQVATAAVANSKVQFVLGDLLPGDLVDEYRVQLQKFLQDPSDANIDAVLAAIEAKAHGIRLMIRNRRRKRDGTVRAAVLPGRWRAAKAARHPRVAAERHACRLAAHRCPSSSCSASRSSIPLIDTIRLSFFDIKGLAKPKYVDFGNYIKLFADRGLPQHPGHDPDLHARDHDHFGVARLGAGDALRLRPEADDALPRA